MATTTFYNWPTPDDTALVKDGAQAIRDLGSSIDSTTEDLNPATTEGDMQYASATAHVNERLAIGTAGQVLAVVGGVPAWAAPAAGSLTLISTTAMTSGSVITLSSIPQNFNSLYLTITGFQPTSDALIRLTFNGGASANDYANIPPNNNTSFTDNVITICHVQNSTGTGFFLRANFPNYADTTTRKIVESSAINNEGFDVTAVGGLFGRLQAKKITNAITSLVFTLAPSPSTYAAGTMKLFGVN